MAVTLRALFLLCLPFLVASCGLLSAQRMDARAERIEAMLADGVISTEEAREIVTMFRDMGVEMRESDNDVLIELASQFGVAGAVFATGLKAWSIHRKKARAVEKEATKWEVKEEVKDVVKEEVKTEVKADIRAGVP